MINCGLILSSISEEGGGECQDSIVTNIKISISLVMIAIFCIKY